MGEAAIALRFDTYTLSLGQGLTCDGTEVRVTPKSLRVLWILACRAGETVTKAELFRDAWPGVTVSDAALTSCIRELRRALQDDASQPRFIETRHRQGFRFLPPARPVVGPHSRLTNVPPALDAPVCVGREREFDVLLTALRTATAGARQLVVVRGEAGIGKTTLLRTFVARVTGNDATVVAGAACAEAIGGCEPYRPLLDSVSTIVRTSPLDRDGALLRRYAPSWCTHVPTFDGSLQPSPAGLPVGSATTTRMSRELTNYMEALATTHTAVLWIDDVQWADAETLDWLVSFAVRVERARALLIVTLREGHDAGGLGPLARLQTKPSCQTVVLGGLDQHAVQAIVRHGRAHEPDLVPFATRLHARTEGHPLFISLLIDETLEVGEVPFGEPVNADGRPGRRLSDRLRSVIETHIARLDPHEIELLEVASQSTSVEWPSALVASGVQRPVLEVEAALVRLARRQAFVQQIGPARWPDGTVSEAFAFRHALQRDAFGARIGAHRRTLIHAQLGARLERAYDARAHELAVSLARHFEEAGQGEKAAAYLLEAANVANRLGAAEDAARFLRRGLAGLGTVASSAERDALEEALQVRLGAALMAARGWGAGEIEQVYGRARELSERRQNREPQFVVYWGLWLFRWGRGELFEAQTLAERLQQIAAASTDRMIHLQAHHAQWATAFCRGDLEAAVTHADQGWALAERDPSGEAMLVFGNHHAAVCARAFAARARALLGRGESARIAADEAVARARDFGHPFTLALALVFASATHQVLRDALAARRLAAAAEALSLEHGFGLLLAWARALKGWSMRDENAADAVPLLRDAVSAAAGTGSGQFQTWLLALVAETLLAAGSVDEGIAVVDQARALARTTGERFNERELQRIRQELLVTRRPLA